MRARYFNFEISNILQYPQYLRRVMSASLWFPYFTLLALLTFSVAFPSILRVPLEKTSPSSGGNATTENGGDLLSPGGRSSAPLHLDDGSWAFIGPIHLGTPKKKFMMNFDTGSSRLWVFDQYVSTSLDKAFPHNFYDKSESKSYKRHPLFKKKKKMSIQYVDGTHFTGKMGRETIQIGNAVVKNAPFARVINIGGDDSDDRKMATVTPFDGVLGLSLKGDDSSIPTPPFIQMMESGVVENGIISFHYGTETTGEALIGGIDEKLFEGTSLHYVKLLPDDTRWDLDIDVSFEGIEFKRKCLFDTGSSVTLAPMKDLMMLVKKIPGIVEIKRGQYEILCSALESLSSDIVFKIGGRAFPLTSKDYFRPTDPINCMFLILGRSRKDQLDTWTMGLPFFMKYYTSFDFKNKQIGFGLGKKEHSGK